MVEFAEDVAHVVLERHAHRLRTVAVCVEEQVELHARGAEPFQVGAQGARERDGILLLAIAETRTPARFVGPREVDLSHGGMAQCDFRNPFRKPGVKQWEVDHSKPYEIDPETAAKYEGRMEEPDVMEAKDGAWL